MGRRQELIFFNRWCSSCIGLHCVKFFNGYVTEVIKLVVFQKETEDRFFWKTKTVFRFFGQKNLQSQKQNQWTENWVVHQQETVLDWNHEARNQDCSFTEIWVGIVQKSKPIAAVLPILSNRNFKQKDFFQTKFLLKLKTYRREPLWKNVVCSYWEIWVWTPRYVKNKNPQGMFGLICF